jgi:NTP pyrophosphatase (non-canonical NTP hydrolase)
MNNYQQKALQTNMTKDDKFKELMQQVFGLADEAGEVQAIFKKWIRDDNADIAKLNISSVKKELGDILWYIAVVADCLGISLEEVARMNIEKLAARQKKGTIAGSGDER